VIDGVSLNGTVDVALPAGAVASPGAVLPLLSAQSRSGTFADEILAELPDGLAWSVDYSSIGATLRVTEPCFSGGLLSWWPGEGDATDSLGQHHGTLANGATFAPGYIGQAFQLDGVDDYVELGGWTPGPTWTLEAWVNAKALPAGRHAILGNANACRDWGIVLQDGQWGVMYRQPGGCSLTLPPAPPRPRTDGITWPEPVTASRSNCTSMAC
jgi:hypothetical protein